MTARPHSRSKDGNGNAIPFTCENPRFKTNIECGYKHGSGQARGSASRKPLIENDDSSLWLEHVFEKKEDPWDAYWLMWYDKSGNPTLSGSAVFTKDDIGKMVARLNEFIDP